MKSNPLWICSAHCPAWAYHVIFTPHANIISHPPFPKLIESASFPQYQTPGWIMIYKRAHTIMSHTKSYSTEFLAHPSVSNSTVVLAEMSLVLMVLVPLWATIPNPPSHQYVVLYVYRLHIILVWIEQCICPSCKTYLSHLLNRFVRIVKCICQNHKMLLVLMVLVPLSATTPILSTFADGSLGYNHQIWWHLSCIFLNYAFVEWKSDTRTIKMCFVIANQIWINRRVFALFIYMFQICKSDSRQPHLFWGPLASIVWSQWRGQWWRYTKYTNSQNARLNVATVVGNSTTHIPVSFMWKHLSLTQWWYCDHMMAAWPNGDDLIICWYYDDPMLGNSIFRESIGKKSSG